MNNGNNLVNEFIGIFERLIAREKIELYEKDLGFLFEVIAENFIESPLWFDGAVDLSSEIKKSHQIAFDGKMRVGEDSQKQWLEPFEAIVTDK